MPIQDTPSVKFTYDASVSVPHPLVALMSACSKSSSTVSSGQDRVIYDFEQKIPIPSYLLALAVGDLVSRDIGPISRVWTEKEMIDAAAYEFEGVSLRKFKWSWQYNVCLLFVPEKQI